MAHALFMFDDPEAARRAADRLSGEGFGPDAVRLHTQETGTVASGTAEADEIVTGGFITNFMGLLDGIFQRDQTSAHVKSFGVHLEQGGAILCVEAFGEDEYERVERVMDAAGTTHHGGWSRARMPA
jgi:hypothetical protein